MADLKRTFRRLRSIFWTALTLILVTLAVFAGIGKLLLPYSERFKPELEARLSDYVQYPVRLKSLTGDWKSFGPRLELEGLQIFPDQDSEAPLVTIEHAGLDIHPFRFLLPGRPLYTFRIIGADLHYQRDENGVVRVGGMGLPEQSEAGSGGLRWMTDIGDVHLVDARIRIDDEPSEIHVGLYDVDARLQMRDQLVAAEMALNVDTGAESESSGRMQSEIQLQLAGSRLQSVSAHMSGNELNLGDWLPLLPERWRMSGQGQSDNEAWLKWDPDTGLDVQGRIAAENLSVQLAPGDVPIEIEQMAADWHLRRTAYKHYGIEIANLDMTAAGEQFSSPHFELRRNPAPGYALWVSADQALIGVGSRISQSLMRRFSKKVQPRWLDVRIDGLAQNFELLLTERWRPARIQLEAGSVSLANWPKWPAMDGMQVKLDFEQGFGELDIQSEQFSLDWPRVFKQKLVAGRVACGVTINWRARGDWDAAGKTCSLANEALQSTGDFRLVSNQKRPYMEAEFDITEARIEGLDPYWADAILPVTTTAWLRRSLVSGRLEAGKIWLDGDLDDWPFRGERGSFRAELPVHDAELDYTPGWPKASSVSGLIKIHNDQLAFDASSGVISQVDLTDTRVAVKMRRPASIDIAIRGKGGAGQVAEFVRQSPLDEIMNTDLSILNLTGKADLQAALAIIPSRTEKKVQVDGIVGLSEAILDVPAWQLLLEDISGDINFTEQGIEGSGLEAIYRGQPSTLDLKAGPGFAAPLAFSADIKGRFSLAELLPESVLNNARWVQYVNGSSDWQAGVRASRGESFGTKRWLELESDLQGMSVDLPAPFAKSADISWPVRLRLPLDQEQPLLELDLLDRAAMQIQLDKSSNTLRGISLQLGDGQVEPVTEGLMRASGSTDMLDLDGWVKLMNSLWEGESGSFSGLKAAPLSVTADRLYVMDRSFQQVALDLTPSNDRWEVIFEGENINGRLRLPSITNNAVVADFERLILPKPESVGIKVDLDPRTLPTIHFYAKEFSYFDVALTDMRIETWPVEDGMHFETAEGASSDLAFRASGDWLVDGDHQRSQFDITLTAEDLGSLASSLKVRAPVEGGQTVIHFDAWWPGAPAAFALARLNGLLEVSVSGGQIIDAQPGAGRLLGLLSLQALPRRLALDFRDVFDKGFAFDEAAGTFRLADGVATTEDFEIKSTAASIQVKGSTNLADKQYDQTITVLPGVGSTLPVIGAIAGGPGGAAAGLALQGIFQKSLGEATRVQYSITGSWTDPVVTPVAVEAAAVEEKSSAVDSTGTGP